MISAIDGVFGLCEFQVGRVIGVMVCGERVWVSWEGTWDSGLELETVGKAGMVLAPRGRLTGAVNTSDVAPSAAATTTALSTTFASAITILPVSVDDYVVADVVNEENVQPNEENVQPNVEYKGEGSAAADINFKKEELDTTP
ncbi:hypothetical protein Tco_0805744 [Tanacetum coccineum]